MQKLHMTHENQQMVRDMLKQLHGEELDLQRLVIAKVLNILTTCKNCLKHNSMELFIWRKNAFFFIVNNLPVLQ